MHFIELKYPKSAATETSIMEDNIYEQLGRFVIQFERVCGALEKCIRVVLKNEGIEKKGIQDVLLAGMTAYPLRELAQSLIAESIHLGKEETALITFVLNEFDKLTKKRNDLIHGKHWVYSSMEGENRSSKIDYMVGSKLHKNKTGADTKELDYQSKDLIKLIADAKSCFYNVLAITKNIEELRPLLTGIKVIKGKKTIISIELLNELEVV
jgi:hypothetical protein